MPALPDAAAPVAFTQLVWLVPVATLLLCARALSEGLVTTPALAAALAFALAFHVAEVGHGVFKRW